MSKPTLSVIMANYNYAQYIGEALAVILSQSYQPLEIIVIDDCSTDNSVEVVKELMINHPNIRLLRNAKNMGGLSSVNKALKEATGDYIYSAASDDKVLPGFFKGSMELLEQNPYAGLCFCDGAILDGNKVIENRTYLSDTPCYFSPDELFNVLRRTEFTVFAGIGVIVKRSALIEAGGYLPQIKWSSDIFVHHVIGFRYGACYLPQIAGLMRKHEKQYTAKHQRPIAVELEVIKNTMDVILMPQYADVRDKFMRTAPFAHCTWDILKLVVINKKYRGFFSVKLLRYALFDRFIRRVFLWILPLNVWRVLLNHYKHIKLTIKKPFNKVTS